MPMRVTITGADNDVDPGELVSLSESYPFVEWGILYSHKRMGTARYPDSDWIAHLDALAESRANLAVHLCGQAARELMDHGRLVWLGGRSAIQRVQVNGYKGRPHQIGDGRGFEFILQVRDVDLLQDAAGDALALPNASILYDPSGGRGHVPEVWPGAPAGVRMGVAGGITPETVVAVAHRAQHVAASWIDMESGVRTDDRFDMDKVRAVLEACAKETD